MARAVERFARQYEPSAEVDTHPGREERIAQVQAGWMGRFVELIRQTRATGEIDATEDPMQLGFEC